jgi:hypothetical protein
VLSGTGRSADAWHPFAWTSARLAAIRRTRGSPPRSPVLTSGWRTWVRPGWSCYDALGHDERSPTGQDTRTGGQPNEYSLVVAGVFLSIVPLAALFLSLQRFWRIDLICGGLKA